MYTPEQQKWCPILSKMGHRVNPVVNACSSGFRQGCADKMPALTDKKIPPKKSVGFFVFD
jgi:hypothetical protein